MSDSTAFKDSEAKSNLSVDDDNEQVDSSTTELIMSESKDGSDDKSESEKVDEDKKEDQDDAPTPAKKKTPSRKRPSKSSSSKSPRSSK